SASLSGGAAGPSSAEGPLSLGSYSFQAHYGGNPTYPAQDGSCESLTVYGSDPSVATTISDANGTVITSVPAGTTVTDVATVCGAAATPTGTVSFTFFTTSDCSGQGSAAGSGIMLSNSNATSSAEGPLPVAAYSFKAHYNGDTNYTAGDGA